MIQKVKHVTVFCFALILVSATWNAGVFLVQQGLRQIGGVAEQEFAEFQKSCERAAMHAIVKRAIGTEAYAATGGHVISVEDTGVVGNGVADDQAAIQAAVTRLVLTGGAVYLPENLTYKSNASVDIRSRFPIFIVSNMQTAAGIVNSNISAKTGHVKPGATITNGMFRWRKPADAASDSDCGGGGIIGVTIADVEGVGGFRTQTVDMAVNVEHASNFTVRDVYVHQIKGSAFKWGVISTGRVEAVRVMACGNTNQPAFWVHGGGVSAAVRSRSLWIEESYLAPGCKVETLGALSMENGHFENATNAVGHVDADGTFNAIFSGFGGCTATNAVVLRAPTSSLDHCGFVCTTTGATLVIDDQDCHISHIRTISAKTGVEIQFTANALYCTASNVYMATSGSFDASAATHCQFDSIFSLGSSTTQTHQIKLGDYSTLTNGVVDGLTTATAKGILLGGECIASGCRVSHLNNAAGIETGFFNSTVTGCRVTDLNGGAEYILVAGCVFEGNYPWAHVASALTIASGAITRNLAKTHHTLAGEGGVADDLNTINGAVEGHTIWLRAASDTVDITIKHGTGNVQCDGNADIVLNSTNDQVECFYNGTKWLVKLTNAGA